MVILDLKEYQVSFGQKYYFEAGYFSFGHCFDASDRTQTFGTQVSLM